MMAQLTHHLLLTKICENQCNFYLSLVEKAIPKRKQQLLIDHSIVYDCEIELLQLKLVFNVNSYRYRQAVKYLFDPSLS